MPTATAISPNFLELLSLNRSFKQKVITKQGWHTMRALKNLLAGERVNLSRKHQLAKRGYRYARCTPSTPFSQHPNRLEPLKIIRPFDVARLSRPSTRCANS